MLKAFILGLIAGLALLLGAIFGLVFKPSKKIASLIMAFGSGVLISALAFDLMEDAYLKGGIIPISLGVLLGAGVFVFGDYLLGKRGGHYRKHLKIERSGYSGEANSMAIAMGALLDGIPESAMIGIGLLTGGSTGILMFSAVFLSNIPEGISGVFGISHAKKTRRFIFTLWILIALVCGLAALIGFKFLASSSGATLALVSAVAAGSILAMISDTMIPEAFEEGGVFVALSTVCGFLSAFIISRLS